MHASPHPTSHAFRCHTPCHYSTQRSESYFPHLTSRVRARVRVRVPPTNKQAASTLKAAHRPTDPVDPSSSACSPPRPDTSITCPALDSTPSSAFVVYGLLFLGPRPRPHRSRCVRISLRLTPPTSNIQPHLLFRRAAEPPRPALSPVSSRDLSSYSRDFELERLHM